MDGCVGESRMFPPHFPLSFILSYFLLYRKNPGKCLEYSDKVCARFQKGSKFPFLDKGRFKACMIKDHDHDLVRENSLVNRMINMVLATLPPATSNHVSWAVLY